MLSDKEIKAAVGNGYFIVTDDDGSNPRQSMLKLDGDNLWLELLASGPAEARTYKGCWRRRFIRPLNGKPTRMSLGEYPFTGLSQAREKGRDVRKMLEANPPIDPIEQRRNERNAARAQRSFEDVITEWFATYREHDMTRSKSTRLRDLRTRKQLIELFGKRNIADLKTPEIIDALLKVAIIDGHKPKARHLRWMIGDVFKYAIARKECTVNPVADDMFDLPVFKSKKLPAIVSARELGELLRRIDNYDGRVFTRAALLVMAHTFPRPANIAEMEWDEIKDGVWIIPDHKMKMRREHRVPLSRQVLAILAELRKLTNSRYVFSTGNKPMGSKTLNRALRAMGYTALQHCAHGFRSTASTLLNGERRFPADIIELQLAHGNPDKIKAAYDRVHELDAVLMEQKDEISDRLWQVRVKMMQHWSDRLDALRADDGTSNVVPMKAAA